MVGLPLVENIDFPLPYTTILQYTTSLPTKSKNKMEFQGKVIFIAEIIDLRDNFI